MNIDLNQFLTRTFQEGQRQKDQAEDNPSGSKQLENGGIPKVLFKDPIVNFHCNFWIERIQFRTVMIHGYRKRAGNTLFYFEHAKHPPDCAARA